MSVTGWVIIVIVVAGIVIALFGWDRYRGDRKGPGDDAPGRRTRSSSTRRAAVRCASGTTSAPGSASTGPSEPRQERRDGTAGPVTSEDVKGATT
jgi:hypothetical protein